MASENGVPVNCCPNCGEKNARHFAPPSFGTGGFYVCEAKKVEKNRLPQSIESMVADLEILKPLVDKAFDAGVPKEDLDLEYLGNAVEQLKKENPKEYPATSTARHSWYTNTIEKLVDACNEKDKRIAEQEFEIAALEHDKNDLQTQVLDLQSSEQGHVRAREMDEAQIKNLIEENKRLSNLVGKAFDAGMDWLKYEVCYKWIASAIPYDKNQFLKANEVGEG